MSEYIFNQTTGCVIRTSDNKIVSPCQSSDDPDFIQYTDWINEGNEPETIVTENIIEKVTAVQLRLCLNSLGLRTEFETAMKQTSQSAQDTWEYAIEYDINNVYVKELFEAANLDIESTFVLASTL